LVIDPVLSYSTYFVEEIDLRVKDSTRLKDEARAKVIHEGLEEVRMGLVEVGPDDELGDSIMLLQQLIT